MHPVGSVYYVDTVFTAKTVIQLCPSYLPLAKYVTSRLMGLRTAHHPFGIGHLPCHKVAESSWPGGQDFVMGATAYENTL